MLLRVFAHVEADELDAQRSGQHASHLGLAHARRPHEEQRGQRLVIVEQSGTRHLHGLDHLTDGLVLTVDLRGELVAERGELLVVVFLGHCQRFDLAGL